MPMIWGLAVVELDERSRRWMRFGALLAFLVLACGRQAR